MLSIMIAISAFCISLVPSIHQNTYAADLAQAIVEILPRLPQDKVETYHYSNEGVASWYDFAVEIMALSHIDCKVLPIESKDYPTAAKRAARALNSTAGRKSSACTSRIREKSCWSIRSRL